MEPGVPAEIFLTLPGYEHLRPNVRQASGIPMVSRDWTARAGMFPWKRHAAIVREQWPVLDEANRQRFWRNTRDTMALEDAGRGFSRVGLEFSGAVLVLMGLVGTVFLIACANLATLLFVRGAGRVREMSIRFALGAARGQLIRQWMTECLLLALVGGLFGVIAARWITDLLLIFVSEADRSWLRFQSEPIVLAPGPRTHAGRRVALWPVAGHSSDGRTTRFHAPSAVGRGQRAARWLTQAVLAGQLAASLVLVVGGALFARTLWNLNGASSGFDRKSVVYGAPNFRPSRMPRDQWTGAMTTVLDQLKRSPSIVSAAMGSSANAVGRWRLELCKRCVRPQDGTRRGQHRVDEYPDTGILRRDGDPDSSLAAISRRGTVRRRREGQGRHRQREAGAALFRRQESRRRTDLLFQ